MKSRQPMRIAVFASGTGSNFKALVSAAREGVLSAQIRALVCDQPKAPVVELAGSLGVDARVVDSAGLSRAEHEKKILAELAAFEIDWVVLAGYMRILSEDFLKKYRAVNIHPSLLPAFPGKNAYTQALAHGCKVTGVTVHLVSPVCDGGPILAQAALEILEGDTPETLAARGLKLEHGLYARTLQRLFEQEAGGR